MLNRDLTTWRTCWGRWQENPEVGDPEIHEEDRVAGLMPGVSCQLSVVSCRELLPATGDDAQGLSAGQTTRSVAEAVSTRSMGTGRVENPRSGGETSISADAAPADCFSIPPHTSPPHRRLRRRLPHEWGGAEELQLQAQLAIETVKRQARAGPMAEAIRDLLACSPEAMEILEAFIP